MAEARGTFFSTSAGILNNVIGAGLLALPFTMHRASLVPGAACMVVTGILNGTTTMLIAASCAMAAARRGGGPGSRIANYTELAEAVLGPTASRIIAAVMAVYTLGTCVSYVALLGDAIPELLGADDSSNAGVSAFEKTTLSLPVAAALVMLPLSLQRNLSSLRYTAAAAILCIAYTSAMIIGRSAQGSQAPPGEEPVLARGGIGLFVGLPITMVAYTMHYNVPRFFGELQGATLGRFGAITALTFTFTVGLYEAVAISGYELFGEATAGDILKNFSNTDSLAIAARAALIIVMLFSYPLAFNSHRACVLALLPAAWRERIHAGPARAEEHLRRGGYSRIDALAAGADAETGSVSSAGASSPQPAHGTAHHSIPARLAAWFQEDWPHTIVTVLLVATSVAVALALPQVEVILGYKGALGGTWIVYILPAFMYYALARTTPGGVAGASRALAAEAAAALAGGAAAKGSAAPLLGDAAPAAAADSPPPALTQLLAQVGGWRGLPRDLLRDGAGGCTVLLILWGFVIMVLGTLTTAGVIG